MNQDYEDILCISLIHNRSLESVGLCVCYLPPSNSSRGDNSLEFFNVLKMLVLKMQMYDAFMLCWDFNARCSNKSDTDTSLCPTNLPVRSYTDNAPSNSYGTSLTEFMIECDLCMLNGRFGDNSNRFKCVSTKGASVVDYTLVPTRNFHSFTDFSIHYMTDEIINLREPLDRMISDHSLLKWKYKFTPLITFTPASEDMITHNIYPTPRLHKVKVPDNYLTNPLTLQSIVQLTYCINTEAADTNTDHVYNTFCSIILNELPIGDRKSFNVRVNKQWWDDELKQSKESLQNMAEKQRKFSAQNSLCGGTKKI